MKTTLRSIIAVVVFMVTTNLANATNPVVNLMNDNAILLSINKLTSDIKIKFTDKEGYELYSEYVKENKASFRKKISIESLPDGVYNLEIEDNVKVISMSVSIKNGKIALNENGKELSFKPFVYKKGEKIFISQFSPDKEPLNVVIYNDKSDVVYKETLTGKIELGRVYSFKDKGDYTIALNSNNKTFEHTVSINK